MDIFNSPLRTAQIADTIWLQYNALTNYKGSNQLIEINCHSCLIWLASNHIPTKTIKSRILLQAYKNT